MRKGILFDSDGVLVDSEGIYFRAVRDTFKEHKVEINEEEYVRRWMTERTKTRGTIKDYEINATVAEIRQLKESYLLKYLKDLQIMQGALDLLKRINGKYPLGLVTSARRREALIKLNKFDLMRFFKVSVYGDEVKNGKPHGEPYIRGCELLGINPEYVVVIEDNPTGVESGKNAGCKVIAYPNGFTLNMDFSLADRVVKSLDEIDDNMIEELLAR